MTRRISKSRAADLFSPLSPRMAFSSPLPAVARALADSASVRSSRVVVTSFHLRRVTSPASSSLTTGVSAARPRSRATSRLRSPSLSSVSRSMSAPSSLTPMSPRSSRSSRSSSQRVPTWTSSLVLTLRSASLSSTLSATPTSTRISSARSTSPLGRSSRCSTSSAKTLRTPSALTPWPTTLPRVTSSCSPCVSPPRLSSLIALASWRLTLASRLLTSSRSSLATRSI